MKVKELGAVEEAQNEIENERNEKAKELVKRSLKRITKAKQIVSDLEKKHEELLDMETGELDFDDFDY